MVAVMKEYVPKEILMTLGGITIDGFEEGSFITISKTEDNFSVKSGIGGEGVRINKQNNFYTIEITLLSVSSSNDYLSALATADSLVPGTGKVPVTINNGVCRDLFGAAECWVVKPADTTYSDAADPKVWTFGAFNPAYFPGGS